MSHSIDWMIVIETFYIKSNLIKWIQLTLNHLALSYKTLYVEKLQVNGYDFK